MLYGVDVSSYQGVEAIPTGIDFGVARASYGKLLDKRVASHVERIRSLGATPGIYHFFLPTQSVQSQVETFEHAARLSGLTVGDLIPFVDVEAYPVTGGWVQPSPEWCAQLLTLLAEMERSWGGCGVYLTNADWLRLGMPRDVVDRPLWVAHWIGERSPACPAGKPWAIHQYRVGPYQRGAAHVAGQTNDPHAIDHDRALVLPLIHATHTRAGVATGMPPMIDLYDGALDGMREERDRVIQEEWAPELHPLLRGNQGGFL